jgi:hypothetical protein
LISLRIYGGTPCAILGEFSKILILIFIYCPFLFFTLLLFSTR